MFGRSESLRKAQRSNEAGFAAIVVSIILVVVLSLITVGFAALMRHEENSALDRQLSNSAYFAAESGINDAAAAVRAGFTASKTKCAPYSAADVNSLPPGSQAGATQFLMDSNIDSASNTNYTCLLIDPTPGTLEYSSVGTYKATTTELTGIDSSGAETAINKLVFSWQDKAGGKVFAPYTGCAPVVGGDAFPPENCWANGTDAITGILRVQLVPMNSIDRTSLINSEYTGYFYPKGSAGATPITSAPVSSYGSATGTSAGTIVDGACYKDNTPRACSVAVTGLTQTTYLLRLSSIYRDTQVTVTPYHCAGPCTPISLKGAQTVIDSTGKAQDVLRRIQVRLPLTKSFDYPEFAAIGDICKQLSTYPNNQDIQNLDPSKGGGNTTLGGCTGL